MSMSEVDYTQFAYKKNVDKKEEKKEAKMPIREKNKSNKLFIFVVILLCFGLVFFSVDFFKNGYLVNLISNAFKGNSYNYYLVVSEHSSRELAYQQSENIKKGGGSGYVWQDEKYYVVYSLYIDKSSATTVANKNTRTSVKTVEYTSKKTEVFNFCNEIIKKLSISSNDYETGAKTESELLSDISSLLTEAKALSLKLKNSKKQDEINLLNLTIECLNNINVAKSSKLALISDIRYVCSSIAINMSDYV